ncbi:hypothetical protein [uncultured Nocardioides sp.]|uniref:hypothetical protein n=1 Tax=uncultured Nocardioides sp. TaxID=198441 RepID=UPI00262875EC|nr:hypothetical protein [uncultured Nocardioides sp.]
MSESGSEQTEQSPSRDEGQQGIPDSALPEDVRPAEDNPLADPNHEIGGGGGDDEDDPTS